MHLIADSGSTKTDWALVDQKDQTFRTHSKGLNPIFLTEKQIKNELSQIKAFDLYKDKITSIQFYGAGCSSEEHKLKLKNAIIEVYPNVSKISIKDDLWGAVHSTVGHQNGIVGILGTGSNACYFDGINIIQNSPSLGYILGDEGSGAYFGKILLQKYLYKSLPKLILDDFADSYGLDKTKIIKAVYQDDKPNAFLASFMPFYVKHRNVLEIKHILSKGFETFFKNHILCYEESSELPIHFVGSIAKIFHPELLEVATFLDLQLGKIVQSPIDELIKKNIK